MTKDDRQIAGAYFYLQLDCLVAYGYQVACDFFRRPHLYTALGGQARELARLRAQYGNDERVPSQEQRDKIFLPLFGQSGTGPANEQGDFPRLRDELVDAAAAYAERVYDTGVEMLRERVRTTHRPFKDYLTGLQGDSLAWSTDEALTGVARKLAYPILRNQGVSSVFGISTAPKAQWPFAEDSNATCRIPQDPSSPWTGLAGAAGGHAPCCRAKAVMSQPGLTAWMLCRTLVWGCLPQLRLAHLGLWSLAFGTLWRQPSPIRAGKHPPGRREHLRFRNS